MILLKKALRSMWDNKRAYAACIVLIATGILAYVAMGIGIERLDVSADMYYRENNMADAFATVSSIPGSAAESLRRVDGVDGICLGLTHDARVYMPGNEKIITMRLVSVDMDNDNPINRVSWEGTGFSGADDILVSEGFLTAHGFAVGDSVTLVINGQKKELNICGTGQSPEYVYIVKDASEILPDDEAFAIGYMPVSSMASMLGKEGRYNNAVFTLEPGYTFDDVKAALEDELAAYGLIQLYGQEDHISHIMLDEEITAGKSMTTTIPFVFVAMAVVVLYLMLKRVIEQDRTQIGTMKAFGYKNHEIIGHYLLYGIVPGLLGAAIGVSLGYLLSGYVTELYNQYYKLPTADYDVVTSFVVNGLLIGLGGGLFGAFMGVRSVLALTPAESMRPEAPKSVSGDSLRFLPLLRLALNSSGSMAMRSLLRNKLRSGFVVLGIMFSYGILAFMASYMTMVDDMLIYQFSDVQKYDIRVSFSTPVSYNAAIESVADVEGVTLAEGFLEVPVELSRDNIKSGISITGINADSILYSIYDVDMKTSFPPPEDGVILSNMLADSLNAKPGDTLILSSAYLSEDVTVQVAGVVTQNLGSSCYMERTALAKLTGLGDIVTSVGVNTSEPDIFKDYILDGDNVGVIDDKLITLRNYRSFMGTYEIMIQLLEVIAVVIAFAIIYNTAAIALSERKREYATLRVLGMHVREVGAIMAFEYWALCLMGVLLGIPFTRLLKETLARAVETEAFAFPTYTPPSAYVAAIIGCVIAVLLSNYSSTKKIRGFDMVEVLKERE